MDRRYDIITFDCYGTLIDWESGIAGAFRQQQPTLDRAAILKAYAETEAEVESNYDLYRNVLTKTARKVGEKLGWSTDGRFLPESLQEWKPFADTNPALERLKNAGYKLGILSNVDDDLLEKTRCHFTVEFDLVVTAQQVRSYKPGRAHFERAKEMIANARWLHAAQSNFHDVVPVNAFGTDTAWVNRHGEQPLPGGTPTYEVRDMKGLADLLA